jgi:SAM-dependent methyltransferase
MGLLDFLKPRPPAVGLQNESTRVQWLQTTLAAIPAGSRLLDAGAGTQQYRKFCTHLNYVSQDFAEYRPGDSPGLHPAEFDYGKLDIVGEITSIPQPDGSFDAIMCVEVLEHLPDPVPAIAEFARLLKPNGYLILTAPFCSLTHFAPYHFSSGFNRFWYEKHLSDYHFQITQMVPNGNYFEYLAQEIYRIPTVSQKYAGGNPGFIEKLSMYLIQRMLLRFTQRDSNSAELLCFGYHVVARKI